VPPALKGHKPNLSLVYTITFTIFQDAWDAEESEEKKEGSDSKGKIISLYLIVFS